MFSSVVLGRKAWLFSKKKSAKATPGMIQAQSAVPSKRWSDKPGEAGDADEAGGAEPGLSSVPDLARASRASPPRDAPGGRSTERAGAFQSTRKASIRSAVASKVATATRSRKACRCAKAWSTCHRGRIKARASPPLWTQARRRVQAPRKRSPRCGEEGDAEEGREDVAVRQSSDEQLEERNAHITKVNPGRHGEEPHGHGRDRQEAPRVTTLMLSQPQGEEHGSQPRQGEAPKAVIDRQKWARHQRGVQVMDEGMKDETQRDRQVQQGAFGARGDVECYADGRHTQGSEHSARQSPWSEEREPGRRGAVGEEREQGRVGEGVQGQEEGERPEDKVGPSPVIKPWAEEGDGPLGSYDGPLCSGRPRGGLRPPALAPPGLPCRGSLRHVVSPWSLSKRRPWSSTPLRAWRSYPARRPDPGFGYPPGSRRSR